MKSISKSFYLVLLLFFLQINLFSQNENQVVSLTVTSQGGSQEEAKNNALRNAIQQTIGVFISANSTILNDNLVKDEIVSISNGTIQKYQILDEGELSNGIYFVTLNAEVSVTKLNSFIENKGVKSSFNGSLFSFNIKQKELSTINETKAIQDLKLITDQLLKQTFEYDLKVGDPKNEDGEWVVPIDFKSYLNFNFVTFYNLVINTMESLSLPLEEQNSYMALGLPSYGIDINGKVFYFRNLLTLDAIVSDIFFEIPKNSLNFTLTNMVQNVSFLNEYYYSYYSVGRNIYNYNNTGKIKTPNDYEDFKLLKEKFMVLEKKVVDNWNSINKNHSNRIKFFKSVSGFQLISSGYNDRNPVISSGYNDRNPDDIFNIIRRYCSFNSGNRFFDVTQFLHRKEDPIFGIKDERVILNLFISKFEKNLIKKIVSISGSKNINDFKIEFSNSNVLLKYTNDELSKLDGFEIKRN